MTTIHKALAQALGALESAEGHKLGCKIHAFGDRCTCGFDEQISSVITEGRKALAEQAPSTAVELQRYEPEIWREDRIRMEPDSAGDWVKFDDVAALLQSPADHIPDAGKMVAALPVGDMPYLCNGTRFKVCYTSQGGGVINVPQSELAGRWVALVAADDDCHLAAARPQPASEQASVSGYKLVPVEPTPEMIAALWAYKNDSLQDCYRAILAAAPEVKP